MANGGTCGCRASGRAGARAGQINRAAPPGQQRERAEIEKFRPDAIPLRDPQARPNLIDLSAYYNSGLTETWEVVPGKNDFSELPTGLVILSNVMFDIRGLIQVGNRSGQRTPYPKTIEGIVVSNQCHQLHFLHAAIDAGSAENRNQIGLYRIHFVDGRTIEIPIAVGEQLADWFEQPNEAGKKFEIVWTGQNQLSIAINRKIRLFKTSWTNPLPDVPIRTVDFESTLEYKGRDIPAPFLIALTAE